MKKLLAFVLALAMVLGMASVAFAAVSTTVEVVKWDLENGEVYLKVKSDDPAFNAITVNGREYDLGVDFAMDGELKAEFFPGQTYITVMANTWSEPQQFRTPVPDYEVVQALMKANANHEDTVVINLSRLAEPYLVTAADWDLLLNNYYYDGMWWDLDYFMQSGASFHYVKLNIKFVDPVTDGMMRRQYNGSMISGSYVEMGTPTNVVYYIDAADVDYTFSKDVDFSMTNGCVGYSKAAKDVWNAIRKLTADCNPYTFGWTAEQSVMKMTVSLVIPQAWINAYGHKDLSLWAYNAVSETKCAECGAVTGTEAAKLAGDVADANTITQRIAFTTNKLYKTMVLSTGAAAAEATPAKTDANPNTGANDFVCLAIVLSVISLAAAGSFVFSKQR